jgi:hypothetical protein
MYTIVGCSFFMLEAPRSSFYRPKGPRSRWNPFLEGNTCFLSGGTPDCPVHHRTGPVTCPVRDLLPNRAQLTVGATVVLAHWTLPSAHRTVRCANYPLAQATRPQLIVLPTVGTVDRWLTGQSGAPPDSLVNYSRTSPNFSRERPVHRSSVWRTGRCPVHHRTVRCARLSRVLAVHSQAFCISFLFFFSLFLILRQIY